nr:hypothetical protein [Tanacetum cinerariifolium]
MLVSSKSPKVSIEIASTFYPFSRVIEEVKAFLRSLFILHLPTSMPTSLSTRMLTYFWSGPVIRGFVERYGIMAHKTIAVKDNRTATHSKAAIKSVF